MRYRGEKMRDDTNMDDEMESVPERKSKSRVKREMTALQSLGERLVDLTPAQIGKIEMPPDLREAVLFARTLKRGEARRRHLQYIGTLMREADPEPIQQALDDIANGRRSDARAFQKLEQWRDKLIDGDDELAEEILSQLPDGDRQRLRQLTLNARKEKASGKTPAASRALFRYLREISRI